MSTTAEPGAPADGPPEPAPLPAQPGPREAASPGDGEPVPARSDDQGQWQYSGCAVFGFVGLAYLLSHTDVEAWLPVWAAAVFGLGLYLASLGGHSLGRAARRAGLTVSPALERGRPAGIPWLDGARTGPVTGGSVLSGTRDGFRLSVFVEKRREGNGPDPWKLEGSGPLRGIVWELPSVDLPALVAHGPERHWTEVLSEGFWQTLGGGPTPPSAVPGPLGLPRLHVAKALPDFAETFRLAGPAEALPLLTEGVQAALLARPRVGVLLCRGPFPRWEEEGDLGRDPAAAIETLVRETADLRDAVLASGSWPFLAPAAGP